MMVNLGRGKTSSVQMGMQAGNIFLSFRLVDGFPMSWRHIHRPTAIRPCGELGLKQGVIDFKEL